MRTAALMLLAVSAAGAAEPEPDALDSAVARIIRVLEERERISIPFRAEYYETGSGTDGRRMGPRYFAWSPERSVYRGPKMGRAMGIQGWFGGGRVERESLYYKDEHQKFWLFREKEPVGLAWNGTRGKSRGPDCREETGITWASTTYSAFLRANRTRVLGREELFGGTCLKLLVQRKRDRSGSGDPTLLWLDEERGYFPRQVVEFHSGAAGGEERPGCLRLGDWTHYPTRVYRWEELGRRGAVWFPLSIRIEDVDDDAPFVRRIEVVESSARFGEEVTADDFALPGLYFLRDKLEDEYAAVTPFGRVTLTEGVAGTLVMLCVALALLVRRRRRRASIA